VINPADWQSLRLSKDDNGQYYGGGPFTGAYGNGGFSGDMLWGKPAVVTPSIAQGTALVGAFKTCAQVFRRGGITVEMTNSNEDDFLKNLVAIRAEERAAPRRLPARWVRQGHRPHLIHRCGGRASARSPLRV
jgi:HK97 family phage major capsid protein